MNNEFNTNLKNIRKSKGITQEQLAEAVGVSPQAVSKWELNGYPDTPLLPEIAEFLGVTIDELFGNKKEEIPLEKQIIQHFTGMPKEELFDNILKLNRAGACGIIEYENLLPYIFLKGNSNDEPFSTETNVSYSQIELENGYIQERIGQKLRYCLIMPEPNGGFDDLLRYNEKYVQLYSFLSIPNALRTMYFFAGRKSSTYFTVKSVTEELNIDRKNAEEIIGKMAELKFVQTACLDKGNGEEPIYHYDAGLNFVSFLMFSYVLLMRPTSYNFQTNTRGTKPYFKNDSYKIKNFENTPTKTKK